MKKVMETPSCLAWKVIGSSTSSSTICMIVDLDLSYPCRLSWGCFLISKMGTATALLWGVSTLCKEHFVTWKIPRKQKLGTRKLTFLQLDKEMQLLIHDNILKVKDERDQPCKISLLWFLQVLKVKGLR